VLLERAERFDRVFADCKNRHEGHWLVKKVVNATRGDSTPPLRGPLNMALGAREGQILRLRPGARELLEDLFQGHSFPAIGLFD
jgi:hypothetical protein